LRVKIFILLCVFVLASLMLAVSTHFFGDAGNSSAPLSHSVYVWQRQWNESVVQGIADIAGKVDGYCLLAAEVSWDGEVPQVVKVNYDVGALTNIDKRVALAVRIGPYTGSFSPEARAVAELSTVVLEVLWQAEQRGVAVSELQLDFDCAESKLDGYRQLVESIRKVTGDTPLTITVLPCWLKRRAFKKLVRITDGYVLQVHSLERPRSVSEPLLLCDISKCDAWVRQAAAIGVPFTVALPTYGYYVAFDQAGHFLGLSAEGRLRAWGKGTVVKRVNSDPYEIAALVDRWRKVHPVSMRGVSWYRLPVKDDRLNWTLPTLISVIDGVFRSKLVCAVVESQGDGLVDVVLINGCGNDAPPPERLVVRWSGDVQLVARDGLNGYSCVMQDGSSLNLVANDETRMRFLSPAERCCVGWLKFDSITEVKVEIF